MKRRLLLRGERTRREVKDIVIFDDPERMKVVLNKLSWKILELLSEKEMYPMEIAKKLKLHEQKIYYHIRKLAEAGAVKVVREEEKKGATAKYYKTSFPAFGVELPFGYRRIKTVAISGIRGKTRQFFTPIPKGQWL